MNSVHLVIPDLFLPKDIAAEVVAGLSIPASQKMLERGRGEILEPVPLETILCESFGVPSIDGAPVAPISAAFDGLSAGCWMRADPVHLNLQRDQLLLHGIQVSGEEAAAMCVSLNEHFAGQGVEFFAPHPQRWYVKLSSLPRMRTTPLSQAIGGDVRWALPGGEDAARWHRVFNEIQMLLHAHPWNDAREARGEPPVNSVWFWGAGCDRAIGPLLKNYDAASSDDVLAEMFAAASGVPFTPWPKQCHVGAWHGRQLLVWNGLRSALQRGDLSAWRAALQNFENNFAQPLWQALRSGKISRLQLDIPCHDHNRRVLLARGDTWAFWRGVKRLDEYSLV